MTTIASVRASVVLAAAVLAIVACGGGQDTGLSSSSSPSCAAVAGLSGQVNDKGSAAMAAMAATGTVTVDDLYFTPTCLTGASGTVTMTLHNRGHLLHNFSVTEENIDVDIPPGAAVIVKVTVAGKPVHFFCKYHRDAGQQGALLPAS